MSNVIFQTLMQPSPIGTEFMAARGIAGPASYTQGGVVLRANTFELTQLKLMFGNMLSQDGLYFARFILPTGAGSPTVTMLWYNSGSVIGVNAVTIAGAGTGQTNGTYIIAASGGGGVGARVQITVAGGLVTVAQVISPGQGYTSAPTFTVAAGGTPGTLTATLGSVFGQEVGATTNLSTSTIKVGAIGL